MGGVPLARGNADRPMVAMRTGLASLPAVRREEGGWSDKGVCPRRTRFVRWMSATAAGAGRGAGLLVLTGIHQRKGTG